MSKISLGQIDLMALQQYLEIVVGFRKQNDKAHDVHQVGEYRQSKTDEKQPVLANQTAMTIIDKDSFPMAIDYSKNVEEDSVLQRIQELVNEAVGDKYIPERQTILNALMLGGVPADQFLKRVEKDTILTDVNDATYNVSEDIRNLKDELYQLKNQVIKAGVIKDSPVYNGFIDAFLESNPKHIDNTGLRVQAYDSNNHAVSTYENVSGILYPEDIVVVIHKDKESKDTKYSVQKIKNIDGSEVLRSGASVISFYKDNEEDVLENTWVSPTGEFDIVTGEDTYIYKSLGVSENGKFIFGYEPLEQQVQGDERLIIMKDGIDRISVFSLEHRGHGFGTVISIPASLLNNVINSVEVSLSVSGSPNGSIRGYFYNLNNIDINAIGSASSLGEPVAETLSINVAEVSHSFNNITMSLRRPLKVAPGDQLLFVLNAEGDGVDSTSTWNIGGYVEDNCTMEVHKDNYIINNQTNAYGIGNTEAIYRTVENTDMYLAFNVRELIPAEIQRTSCGLYSCEFDTHFSKANRVRVELIVNKEGQFKVNSADNIVNRIAEGGRTQIPLVSQSKKTYKESIFDIYETAIIGKNVFQVHDISTTNDKITAMRNVEVIPQADVYRMGYKVYALARYEEESGYEEKDFFELEFKGVVPGRDTLRPHESSDRLIFEAEFKDNEGGIKLKSFDSVQIQVLWTSNVGDFTIGANEELEGSLFDIVVSTDYAYTTDPTPR